MPKKSYLSEYSSRITPQKVFRLLALWHGQLTGETVLTGASLNLDFHSVPYFGEDPIVQTHYLAKRSRRQPSILTFLAQDADSQVFCYSNADIRKGEERLKHEYELRDDLDSAWAARPLELSHQSGRTMLLLGCPADEPLHRSIGARAWRFRRCCGGRSVCPRLYCSLICWPA